MIKIANCSINEFLYQIETRNIICFCAGQELEELCKTHGVGSKILYIVDNFKSGSEFTIDQHCIPIKSMSEIGNEVKDSILIITSLRYAEEIIKQLDQIPVFEQLIFYIPKLFLPDSDYPEFDTAKPQIIPKILHYCWFGKGKMPEEFQHNIETWKRNCPNYQIMRWDETNYDITKNQYMKQAYEARKWGFVPDYARLDIVNTYGGIYLDTDVEIVQSFDSLLQFPLFCGFENVNYINFGHGFGAKKENHILEAMMEEYHTLDFKKTDGTFNLTASPVYQTKVLEQYGLRRNGQTQIRRDFIALSTEYLSPVNAYGFGQVTKNTFSIHHYASTWYGDKEQLEKDQLITSCRFVMDRMKKD